MAIPEGQLETWSHQGSVTLSASTYATVRRALERNDARYLNRNFEVFLQGSYGNDTNIYAESDVDVVIRYDGAFFHNKSDLSSDQQTAFDAYFSNGTYPYKDFKAHVFETLRNAFGDAVSLSKRAIKIAAKDTRRSADVIVAFEYRRYNRFGGSQDVDAHEKGATFFTSSGSRLINYQKQHSRNLTQKHQGTNGNFKPAIRIFKNLRSKLVTDRMIASDTAPSYFVEGLLYNVPDEKFSGNRSTVVFNVLQWLHAATDRSNFVCANEQYYLLRDGDQVCWPIANGKKFIDTAIELWNAW